MGDVARFLCEQALHHPSRRSGLVRDQLLTEKPARELACLVG
jgi:hypothetical protein